MFKFKINLLVLLALVFLSACKAKSVSSSTPEVIKIDKITKEETKITPAKPIKPEKDTIADIEKEVKPDFFKKDVYEVAILLPFQENEFKQKFASSNKEDLEDFIIPKNSAQSISFLQGAMYALENTILNSKFNLTLYDLGSSNLEYELAVNKMNLNKPDLILGGLNRDQVVQLSNFSQKNKIPYFSPFVPASNIVKSNPYYIMLEPGIEMHLREISSFIADSFLNENIIILHENTSQSKSFAEIAESYFNIFKQNTSSNLEKISVATNASERKNFSIDKYLKSDQNNIIFIPSFNEGFLHAMLTNINAQAQSKSIVVFGMPTWDDAETLQFRHFNTLNLHLTRGNWLNSSEIEDFNNYFLKNYEKPADQSIFYGYESILLINELLTKFGLDFVDYITNEKIEGVARDYRFQAVVDENEHIIRYENTSLKVVEIENFELKLKR